MTWSDSDTFAQVETPTRLRQMVADRLRTYGDYTVEVDRFDEVRGKGAITVEDDAGNVSAIPFHLPESEERFYRICRDLLGSESKWNSPHLAERHERHTRDIGV